MFFVNRNFQNTFESVESHPSRGTGPTAIHVRHSKARHEKWRCQCFTFCQDTMHFKHMYHKLNVPWPSCSVRRVKIIIPSEKRLRNFIIDFEACMRCFELTTRWCCWLKQVTVALRSYLAKQVFKTIQVWFLSNKSKRRRPGHKACIPRWLDVWCLKCTEATQSSEGYSR